MSVSEVDQPHSDLAGWASTFLIEHLTPGSKTTPFILQSNVSAFHGRPARLCISSAFEPAILVDGLDDREMLDLMFQQNAQIEVWFSETTSRVPCFIRTADLSGQALLFPRSQPFFVGFADQPCASLFVQWTGIRRHRKMHFLNQGEFSFPFAGRTWRMTGSVSEPEGNDIAHILEVGRSLSATYTAEIKPENGAITSDQTTMLLHRLSSALSFVAGHYSPTVFSMGKTGHSVTWLRFGSDVRIPRSGPRWADNIQRDAFGEYLERYMSAASEEQRGNSLQSIVFLYTQCVSCLPSVAPAILLGQSALEELARWTLLDEEHLQRRFVRDLKAYDLFDLLFSILNSSKDEVAKACWRDGNEPSFSDTIQNLVEVRNSVAHRGAEKDRDQRMTAWEAACRLLEIAVLASLGYRGTFGLPSSSTPVDFGGFYRS